MDSELDVMINDSLKIANMLDSKSFKLSVYELDINKGILLDRLYRCMGAKIANVDKSIYEEVADILLKSILKVMSTVHFGYGNLVEESHCFNSLMYEVDLSMSNLCLNTTMEINYESLFELNEHIAKMIEKRIALITGNDSLLIKPITDFVYEDLIESNIRNNIFYILTKNSPNVKLIFFSLKE